MKQVAVIDYGMGNVDSVARALELCGARAVLTADPLRIERADAIVLPGVGAFGAGMDALESRGLVGLLIDRVRTHGVPFLGICLGMQLLAARGTEGGERAGLGLVGGTVERIVPASGERVPHVGWNEVHVQRETPLLPAAVSGRDFYFTHGYALRVDDPAAIIATTPYAGSITSAVQAGPRAYGVQFHPEKSQGAGQIVLRAFLSAVAA